MKKFFVGVLIIGTTLSVAALISLLYNFVMLLQSLAGG